jgi:hypothetical protein
MSGESTAEDQPLDLFRAKAISTRPFSFRCNSRSMVVFLDSKAQRSQT